MPARVPSKTAQTRARVDRVLRRMQKGASLSMAARRERIKPSTVKRLAGHKLRQDRPGGRFRVTKTGRRVHLLQIRDKDGAVVRVPVATLAKARELSRYENAIGHFLRTGDASRVRRFEGKTVVTEDGHRITLPTDPELLRTLAAADSLRLDSLYADLTRKP